MYVCRANFVLYNHVFGLDFYLRAPKVCVCVYAYVWIIMNEWYLKIHNTLQITPWRRFSHVVYRRDTRQHEFRKLIYIVGFDFWLNSAGRWKNISVVNFGLWYLILVRTFTVIESQYWRWLQWWRWHTIFHIDDDCVLAYNDYGPTIFRFLLFHFFSK